MSYNYICSLRSKNEFELVSRLGRKIRFPDFLAVVAKNISLPVELKGLKKPVFLGMKVSKKHKTAVTRNKIKRRIRHLMRERIKKGVRVSDKSTAVIIIPRSSFATADFQMLSNHFASIVI